MQRKNAVTSAAPSGVAYVRAAFSALLFGLAAWFAISGEARFRLGGSEGGSGSRRGLAVDAHGPDAVAIAAVFLAVGLMNLALAVRGTARLRVFWAGLIVLGGALLYGLAQAVGAIVSLFTS